LSGENKTPGEKVSGETRWLRQLVWLFEPKSCGPKNKYRGKFFDPAGTAGGNSRYRSNLGFFEAKIEKHYDGKYRGEKWTLDREEDVWYNEKLP
jgi:hypothetical protein